MLSYRCLSDKICTHTEISVKANIDWWYQPTDSCGSTKYSRIHGYRNTLFPAVDSTWSPLSTLTAQKMLPMIESENKNCERNSDDLLSLWVNNFQICVCVTELASRILQMIQTEYNTLICCVRTGHCSFLPSSIEEGGTWPETPHCCSSLSNSRCIAVWQSDITACHTVCSNTRRCTLWSPLCVGVCS